LLQTISRAGRNVKCAFSLLAVHFRAKHLYLWTNEILQIVAAASLPPDVPLVRQGWRTYEPTLTSESQALGERTA